MTLLIERFKYEKLARDESTGKRLYATPQGHKVKAQIWDTAGQERFARVLLPTYFRKAKGVILVYDITNIKSFESLSERWMAQLNDHSNSDDLAKLLVGNKSDLESNREVTTDKAISFCQEYGMEFLETSAKSGTNVLPAFEKLGWKAKVSLNEGMIDFLLDDMYMC